MIIDDNGKAREVEILSSLTGRGVKVEGELIYEAREVITGDKKTISEDQILRLATPVDNAAELFSKKKS